MNDPYSVLGVSANADDEDIKKAYRELVRKYHPDNYHDNPLSDLAQEKMKEINEAYDAITKMRSNGGGKGTAGFGGYGARHSGSSTGVYAEIRAALNNRDLNRAEQLLNGISDRGAEWNFLYGSLCYSRGWLDEASRYYANAAQMDPRNPEYRQAYEYMRGGGQAYRTSPHQGAGGVSTCDCCSSLICADCCCECMGGDLISCC